MVDSNHAVEVTLRIPGTWEHPMELVERLPTGFQIEGRNLILPDGTEIEIAPVPADEMFSSIFRSSLRRPATAAELEIVDNYVANVVLCGPGGSLAAARKMMEAGAAVIGAGGGGVFIDNSGLAHGGENWQYMTEDGSSDAVSFAFVSIIRNPREVWTVGMHVAGCPEIVMRRAEADADDRAIIDMICYVCGGDRPVDDGHIIADPQRARFQIQREVAPTEGLAGPMKNPFGRLRMVSIKEIAEQN